ncbi:MAG: hypothetical protein LBG58_03530 [Planctomycetaceae bacterium]|jgi:hypothetical protein|nr:hypothetical protein [Planctomycetaceae bacterium]
MNLFAFDHVEIITIWVCTIIDKCTKDERFRDGQQWVHSKLLLKTDNIVTVKLASSEINTKPRIETRSKVKHSTPCAKPRMCIAGKYGTKIKLHLEFLEGRLHLPIIKVERI